MAAVVDTAVGVNTVPGADTAGIAVVVVAGVVAVVALGVDIVGHFVYPFF